MEKIDLFPTRKSKAKLYKYMTSIGCHDDESESLTHRIGGEIVKAKLAEVLVSHVRPWYEDRYTVSQTGSWLFCSLLFSP
jgi:hypothetical protein